ncbi:hypothetical protein [Xenorhabdus kozodoii]|uniref:Acetyltransferase n=1 Tax=Xenorhabdus kozodoii TaxID=351676 RepID=A0A2D0KZV1_9GAMM|nr:hypothetical protein [Xenorhabdus kozodoii]PHM68932.1 acetyltransferase [Xenorhabdus kozodoii]
MSLFSQTITDFWQAPFSDGHVLYQDDVFTVVINPNLSEDRRVMVLETADGRVMAVLTPSLAEKAGLHQQQNLSEPIFRQKLIDAGIILHGADYLFYFSADDKNVLQQEKPQGGLRQLTEHDERFFLNSSLLRQNKIWMMRMWSWIIGWYLGHLNKTA